jgi:hypothetical protein
MDLVSIAENNKLLPFREDVFQKQPGTDALYSRSEVKQIQKKSPARAGLLIRLLVD